MLTKQKTGTVQHKRVYVGNNTTAKRITYPCSRQGRSTPISISPSNQLLGVEDWQIFNTHMCVSLSSCGWHSKLHNIPNGCVTKWASLFFLLHSSKLLSCRAVNIKKQDRRSRQSDNSKRNEGELTWFENELATRFVLSNGF